MIEGILHKGRLQLKEEINSEKPVRVFVAFPQDIKPAPKKRLKSDMFNFKRCQEILKHVNTDIGATIIQERRG